MNQSGEEPTKEFPVYVGQAPIPVTAVPYTEPTVQFLPPPPPRRRGLFVVGLLTVGLLLCAFGVLVGIAFFGPGAGDPASQQGQGTVVVPSPTPPSTEGPRLATERFLTAVIAGNQKAVDESLCELLRRGGQQDGSGGLGLTFFVSYKVGEVEVTGPTATANVELTLPLLGPIRFDVYLLQEQGGWRVCGGGPA